MSSVSSVSSGMGKPDKPPPPSPMRGSTHLIGVDRHPPSQYPRPGQWMSPHHRVVSHDKKQALQRDYVGIDIAKHGMSLQSYKGTGDYLPMAKWLGSLRNNAEYRQHLEGAPPGVAEAVGVKMVQPPMHYTGASSSATSPQHDGTTERGSGGSGGRSDGGLHIAYDQVTRSILSEVNDEIEGGSGSSEGGSIIHQGQRRRSELSEARIARRRRARQAIVECGGKIGIDHHEPSLYPLPGQHTSKYHRSKGNDKARALARPYVGMNMNHMRRHIATGNGDGRAASNWIGSLRSKAKGADGGYCDYMKTSNERKRRDDTTKEEKQRERDAVPKAREAMPEAEEAKEDGGGGVVDVGSKVSLRELTKQQSRKTKRRVKCESGRGETKYMGNKTQAQMNGVPNSMRWQKPNEYGDTTSGYLRM